MRNAPSALALLVTLAGALAARAAETPNVVFLLADDLGYGDLGCTGHPYAKTPAIDGLAKDGALFKHFYTSGATCCPSRAGLMTGRFPATFARYPAAFGFGAAATVTGLLKERGYHTGHFGKWHMGDVQEPGTFGIDTVEVGGGNRRDPRGRDAEIASGAIDFIRAHKDGPFYVNVWFHTPHNPVRPPGSFVAPFAGVSVRPGDFPNPDMARHLDLYRKLGGDVDAGMRNYLGDVSQLDSQVGRILRAIDDLGLRDDTIVVFTSDNGPAKCSGGKEGEAEGKREGRLAENMLGSAGPYRDRKHSLHDGGIHQPLIVRWPGRVEAGRVDETSVLAGVDWLPTLCSIARAPFDPAAFVGEDVSDVWLKGGRERSRPLFWKASAPRSTPVVRLGRWKLHLPRRGPAELYDLEKDPGERANVAADHPEVVGQLSAALRRWDAGLPTSYEKAGDD